MSRVTRVGLGSFLAAAALAAFAGTSGCRNFMPHSFTWPASGDTVQTHPKPPEGGYWKNWDPYATKLEVTPMEDINPVQTQHIFVATVFDENGEPLPNRRVEWIVSEGSVGDIVEVDESGVRASRGYKVTNKFAVSHTSMDEHVLDMGNDDPSDDVYINKGQTFCVITSPIEGTTHMIAYAPGIYDRQNHKVFAVKHWYDVTWEFPPPATNPTGTTHDFTTTVMKYSNGEPLAGYIVTYKIMDGPSAVFASTGTDTATAETDAQGRATVTIQQTTPAEGTNNIQIDIDRPADTQCCKPGVHIATGTTAKTWVGPKLACNKTGPSQVLAGEQFTWTVTVTNPSPVDATNVKVDDTVPAGVEVVSTDPPMSGSTWNVGTLPGGKQQTMTITATATRTGTFENCAQASADMGLSTQCCASVTVTAPQLALEKQCTPSVIICDEIQYTLIVRNTGDGPANNVVIEDNLPDGVMTSDGKSTVRVNVGTLQAGEARQANFSAKAQRTGTFTNTATATGDGGLSATAECHTTVTEPKLTVTKTGPEMRFIGRPATYEITVGNTGDTAATQTVLDDTIPAGMEFVSASDGGQASGGRITWNLGTLEPGASRTVTVDLVSRGAGRVENTATARAYCTEASDTTEMEIKGVPAILLEVVDVEDPIEVGSQITYIIKVTNQGTSVGTNIVIAAGLPDEQDYVSATGPVDVQVDGRTITFMALPSLAPKAEAEYRVIGKGNATGDVRFSVKMTSDQMTSPVDETESTNIY